MVGSLLVGAFFLLAGLSIFFNIFFGIDIPFGRIFFGLLMLYIGFTLITGCSKCRMESHCCSSYQGTAASHSNWMGKAHITCDEKTVKQNNGLCEYLTIMADSTIDLSPIKPEMLAQQTSPITLSADTIMGKTLILINKDIPVRINARGVFSGTKLPDGGSVVFGSQSYLSHQPPVVPQIIITTSTVFGGLDIIRI